MCLVLLVLLMLLALAREHRRGGSIRAYAAYAAYVAYASWGSAGLMGLVFTLWHCGVWAACLCSLGAMCLRWLMWALLSSALLSSGALCERAALLVARVWFVLRGVLCGLCCLCLC